jgi:aminomethyltransferase
VSRDKKVIGQITSAIHSPRFKKNIGYAMVPVADAALGSQLQVKLPSGEERSANVVTMPFLDPEKKIPKS